jgi:hypothetical protein
MAFGTNTVTGFELEQCDLRVVCASRVLDETYYTPTRTYYIKPVEFTGEDIRIPRWHNVYGPNYERPQRQIWPE